MQQETIEEDEEAPDVVESNSETPEPTEPVCPIICKPNYLAEARSAIFENEEINAENAINLNHQFRAKLLVVKSNLEELLKQCRIKYQENEKELETLRKAPQRNKINRQYSYFFCCAPYFKDKNAIPAPLNVDFLYRQKALKEFFPMELLKPTIFWVGKDKVYLVKGVKEQLIRKLLSLKNDEQRSIRSKQTTRSKERFSLIDDSKSLESKQISELFAMLQENQFTIDWYTVSTKDLDGRHTPEECNGIWNGYLNPALNRNKWTNEEDTKLVDVVNAFNQQNWDAIAKQMDGRSGYQCLIKYRSILMDRLKDKYVRWTPEEDDLLMETIERHRIGSVIPWSLVAEKTPGRSKSQVYNRYCWTLKPGIRKDKFTIEEDCILMAAVKEHGPNFHKFPNHLLPGRTQVQIRNRYNNVLKHVGKNKPWTQSDDEKLMELVKKYGTSGWSLIANELPHHTRFSCRSRYLTITKFLKKHPNKTWRDAPRKRKPFSTNVTENNWMETIYHVRRYGEPNAAAALQLKNKDKKSVFRRTSMKKLNAELYEFFRYSYHFKFESACPATAETTDVNDAVTQILHCAICPRDYKILTDIDGVQMDMECKTIIGGGEQSLFLLPPSYCTSLLYRGLTIMFNNPLSKIVKIEVPGSDALDLFKKRFFSLVYFTALMSKLKFPNVDRTNVEQSMVSGKNDYLEAEDDDEDDNFDDGDDDVDEDDEGADSDMELTKPNVSNLHVYTVGTQNGNKFTISYSDTEPKHSAKRGKDSNNELIVDIKKCRYDSED